MCCIFFKKENMEGKTYIVSCSILEPAIQERGSLKVKVYRSVDNQKTDMKIQSLIGS